VPVSPIGGRTFIGMNYVTPLENKLEAIHCQTVPAAFTKNQTDRLTGRVANG
jgi:hypothetical protein